MPVKYKKAETRSSESGIPVFDMEYVLREDIEDAEPYEVADFRGAVELISEVIHFIPNLFREKISVEHLKIYLGRSSENGLYHRWDSHYKGKDLPYAVPVCVLENMSVNEVERFGLRLLRFLERERGLCFGELMNEKGGSPGREPSGDPMLYLCFGVDKRIRRMEGFNEEELDLAVGHLYFDLERQVPQDEIRASLRATRKESKMQRLYWHKSSRED